MAAIIDTGIVLDALCLAVYSDSDETKNMLTVLTEMYNSLKKKTDLNDRDLDIFFEIITDAVRNGIDPTKKSDKSQILLKVKKSDIGKADKTIVDSVVDILSEDPKQIKPSVIATLQRRIQQWIIMNRSKDFAKRIMMKCAGFNTTDDAMNDLAINDVLEYARKITELEEQMVGTSATIDVVDMSNPSSVKNAMQAFATKRKSGVLKTGLKQLNRMLCPNYGFLRGEFAAFAASSHNFKSGMLMKCARWFCTKSDITVDAGYIPCVVFISLENEIPENSMNMIQEAYIDIYRQPVPPDMDEQELIKKVTEYYASKNVRLLMYRFDENFSYVDFIKLMAKLKAKNYSVIATVLDYITLMRLEGDEKDNQPKRYQKLAHHMADYAKRNDMLIVTGLQLAPGATAELESSGRTNIVKQYRPTHLGDCKSFVNELDILIFLKIEENQDGIPYLTGAWHKHRCPNSRPPKKDQYFAYRFNPVLGILEDEGTDLELNRDDIYSDDPVEDENRAELFTEPLSVQPKENYKFG